MQLLSKMSPGALAAGDMSAATWASLGVLALPLAGSLIQRLFGEVGDQNLSSLLSVFRRYRKVDLTEFMQSHRQACQRGKETGDYVPGVINYYTLMSGLITLTSGPYWHFVPMFRELSRQACHQRFHETLTRHLGSSKGDQVLEIGCGYGEMGRQVAILSGAGVTGLTMADAEIEGGNARIATAGLEGQCRMVQGNYHKMPLEAASFDRVFGVYTLKYSSDLDAVFGEAFRVLKPGGSFLSYEILVTDKFDKSDAQQRAYVESISSSTCMPPLWHAQDLRDAAKRAGLVPVLEEDVGSVPGASPWYSCFTSTGIHQLLSCPLLMPLIKLGERLRILPPSFADWFETCLMHPTTDFVNAGRLGIISGSVVMTWKKP